MKMNSSKIDFKCTYYKRRKIKNSMTKYRNWETRNWRKQKIIKVKSWILKRATELTDLKLDYLRKRENANHQYED